MRAFLVVVVFSAAVSCTKPNPDACCTTEAQCTSFGVTGGVRPCDAARVCTADGACVAPQCMVDMDCTDPSTPVCVASLCVAKCGVDADCTDPAAPKCDSAGACVACIDAGQCTSAEAPVCDGSAHTCRACSADADCESGVCLETSGECAGSGELIYVSGNGADGAACTAAQPCRTIAEATALLTGAKNVIRVIGPVGLGSNHSIQLPQSIDVAIDGDGSAAINVGSGSAMFDVAQGDALTLEGVSVSGVATNPVQVVDVSGGGNAVVDHVVLAHASMLLEFGKLACTGSTLDDFELDQDDGTLVFEANQGTGAAIRVDGGSAEIERSVFASTSHMVSGESAFMTVENNVFTSDNTFTDANAFSTMKPGSTYRFNTMVNTSGQDSEAVALKCDATLDASSNIIAWHASQNGSVECETTYTLYDSLFTQAGVGNQFLDVNTFFVDLAHGDFHLAAGSPALQHGSGAEMLSTDFDGNSRPNPTGTAPDVGAFESPN